MSGVRSYKFITLFFRKIIAKKFGSFEKNSYLCIIDAKQTKASKICGITIAKNFLSRRRSFS